MEKAMNLSKEFKGWNSCPKKQKIVYLEQFLHRYQNDFSHFELDELVLVLWLHFHDEEEDQ